MGQLINVLCLSVTFLPGLCLWVQAVQSLSPRFKTGVSGFSLGSKISSFFFLLETIFYKEHICNFFCVRALEDVHSTPQHYILALPSILYYFLVFFLNSIIFYYLFFPINISFFY